MSLDSVLAGGAATGEVRHIASPAVLMMISDVELISRIHALLALQQHLIDAFKNVYPNARDWMALTDFPKSGELRLDSESWVFKRHGAGLMFINSAGV